MINLCAFDIAGRMTAALACILGTLIASRFQTLFTGNLLALSFFTSLFFEPHIYQGLASFAFLLIFSTLLNSVPRSKQTLPLSYELNWVLFTGSIVIDAYYYHKFAVIFVAILCFYITRYTLYSRSWCFWAFSSCLPYFYPIFVPAWSTCGFFLLLALENSFTRIKMI